MEVGTIIIGLLSQALGFSLALLTTSILLYLIMRVVIGAITFLYKKRRCRHREVEIKYDFVQGYSIVEQNVVGEQLREVKATCGECGKTLKVSTPDPHCVYRVNFGASHSRGEARCGK